MKEKKNEGQLRERERGLGMALEYVYNKKKNLKKL